MLIALTVVFRTGQRALTPQIDLTLTAPTQELRLAHHPGDEIITLTIHTTKLTIMDMRRRAHDTTEDARLRGLAYMAHAIADFRAALSNDSAFIM